jgi:hypothetical protein
VASPDAQHSPIQGSRRAGFSAAGAGGGVGWGAKGPGAAQAPHRFVVSESP